MTDRVACPYCGQDWVEVYLISPTQELFQMCGECECTWPVDTSPKDDNYRTFQALMKARGLEPTWSQIEKV